MEIFTGIGIMIVFFTSISLIYLLLDSILCRLIPVKYAYIFAFEFIVLFMAILFAIFIITPEDYGYKYIGSQEKLLRQKITKNIKIDRKI